MNHKLAPQFAVVFLQEVTLVLTIIVGLRENLMKRWKIVKKKEEIDVKLQTYILQQDNKITKMFRRAHSFHHPL
jgi:hypothetical protein